MKVSVVIPCFNDGEYLAEALRSVDMQTLRDYEVIIVDDGSTDGRTRELLASLTNERVITAAHEGVCQARNRGLAAARGDYVCFFDADDLLRPECLAKACARLDADPALTFVSFWVHLFGREAWDWQPEACDARALTNECCVATAAVTRRDAVVDIGGFDAAFTLGHEDWDLWLSLLSRGLRGEILPELLFDYRRRPGSRSSVADQDGAFLACLRALYRKHEALFRGALIDLLADKESSALHHLERAAVDPPADLATLPVSPVSAVSYVGFAVDGQAAFVALATHTLEANRDLAFVTGWPDCATGDRPCSAAMLLGRPLSIAMPTMIRRSVVDALGLDEARGEVDWCLRALGAGYRGAAIHMPLTPPVSRPCDSRAFFERHRDVVERDGEEILIIKEWWRRQLVAWADERVRLHDAAVTRRA